ncbi:MAG TPA: hypothetical protein VGO52_05040 [Hyphomonadaceae bacterium]|jgi:hypothetical protein|nr:hypothetical protein [Hyphomonadaceae bacterium]
MSVMGGAIHWSGCDKADAISFTVTLVFLLTLVSQRGAPESAAMWRRHARAAAAASRAALHDPSTRRGAVKSGAARVPSHNSRP